MPAVDSAKVSDEGEGFLAADKEGKPTQTTKSKPAGRRQRGANPETSRTEGEEDHGRRPPTVPKK